MQLIIFKSRDINTMLTLKRNWVSVLRETCLCFCGISHNQGGLTLASGLACLLSFCWLVYVYYNIFKTHIALWTSAHMQVWTRL